jgi:prepilin-type N-terminal cleavage/methylation domain-containing protein
MKLRSNLRSKSKGFTLIEILVALAILALLAVLASSAFDGSRSKAQAMVGLGKQIGDANIMLKTDTGCYANTPKALFDATEAAKTSANYCGRSFGNSWARPYLAQYPTTSTGEIMADKIGAEVVAGLETVAGGIGATGKRYFVQFSNVPVDVIKQALLECNGTDEAVTDFSQYRCKGTVTGTTGTFDMLYDTTR